MNRHQAVWTSVLCLGLFASGVGIGQQVSWAHHPNLAAAQHMTEQAIEKLSQAQAANEFDMSGHAARAKDLLERANQEILASAAAANRH